MYKLSVPIDASMINQNNREAYVKLCREAGVKRIFLAMGSIMGPVSKSLAEKIAYFQSNGFEVGVWTSTIGHGFLLTHAEDDDNSAFKPIVDIQGRIRPNAFCPLDEQFLSHISRLVASYAKAGADMVLLDDDFRMSQHGDELCCACEAHLNRIGAIVGEEITIEKIKPYLLSGKANRYRDAWVQTQKQGLIELAQAIRREVDKVAPDVPVGVCTAMAPWNVDGVDMVEIAKILAGKHKPLLRLTGAPYWAIKKRQFPIVTVFEIARMLASFAENKGVELMSEGDTYPRPRYICPASYLELFDAVTRIDGGYDGILKYMFDYIAGPHFEPGYLAHHNENKADIEALADMFDGGANAGVRIIARPHTYQNADLDLGYENDISPRPLDATMLGCSSIPTVYRGRGICSSAFGEHARFMDLGLLEDGVILDAVSAVILTERGIDVGLRSYGKLTEETIARVCTNDPAYRSFITDGKVRLLSPVLDEKAEPLLYIDSPAREKTLAYRYENANGNRFLVFLFEGESIYSPTRVCLSGLVKNYPVQKVLLESVPWIARKKLPAYCAEHPELYLMCKKEENSTCVALFNCFADSVTGLKVHLDKAYTRIECLNCAATVEGDTVTLSTKLHAFDFAAFRVYNDG
ncbi:MAG: hypothetical protein E7624_02755 [Ruminococcaceae bacterium]|nr:hypothetical protein [Oscillospiraceae bacterium]